MRHLKENFISFSEQNSDRVFQESSIGVLVVYPKVLTGLLIAEALSRNPNFHVAAHVSSADAVIAYTTHAQLNVALIAANLTGHGDGLAVLRRVRSECKDLRVIMLFENPDPPMVIDAFRFGAKGVFCMDTNGYRLLCKSIECVHRGQIWANSQELHWVIDSLSDTLIMPVNTGSANMFNVLEFKKLSKRETRCS
jgi:DNA-binding NarL/FixJ family response regulator